MKTGHSQSAGLKFSCTELLQLCRDSAMQKLVERVKMASSARSVLLVGESGSGKEVVARALHEQGDRNEKSLVVVHCGSVNSDLMTSALFGHERGAFTGANEQRIGAFETANGGTVYLDEVSRLQREVQGMLLRALEGESFCRLGSTKSITSNFRVIAATNRDLGTLVSKGEFAEDLFYRLNAVPLKVPSLRERQEDVIRLARLFADQSGKTLQADTEKLLENRTWPGNVRELRNVIERACVFSNGHRSISPIYLEFDCSFTLTESPVLVGDNVTIGPLEADESDELQKLMTRFIDLAKRHAVEGRTISDIVDEFMIRAALLETVGVKTAAASFLGTGRQTIYNKILRYGINTL